VNGICSRVGRVEFRRDLADARRQGVTIVGISPLHDVVVLYSNDGQGIEIPRPGQRFDIGHMQRRKAGRQLDNHPAAGQFDVQCVVRIERPPVRGAGGFKTSVILGAWAAGAETDKKASAQSVKNLRLRGMHRVSHIPRTRLAKSRMRLIVISCLVSLAWLGAAAPTAQGQAYPGAGGQGGGGRPGIGQPGGGQPGEATPSTAATEKPDAAAKKAC